MTVVNPLGFFWDIENCPVPSNKPSLQIVEKLRQKFNHCGAETEFICVCDVTKERADIIEDLNSAQVTVIHVSATSKNAADEKLKHYMRKFSLTHRSPGTIVLITSDINFAQELIDLRYRCGFDIVLLHRRHVSEALLITAHHKYDWESEILNQVVDKVEKSFNKRFPRNECKLAISDLPSNVDVNRIRERLQQLSANCGGRVLNVNKSLGTAILRFSTPDMKLRALTRMQNENVFGCKIQVKAMQSTTNGLFVSSNCVKVSSGVPCFLSDQIVSAFDCDKTSNKFKNTELVLTGTRCNKEPESLDNVSYLNNRTKLKNVDFAISDDDYLPEVPEYEAASSSSGCWRIHYDFEMSTNTKSVRRNLMTDKLKRALGFPSTKNSQPKNCSVKKNEAEAPPSACTGYSEPVRDFEPSFVPTNFKSPPRFFNMNNVVQQPPVDIRVDNLDVRLPLQILKQNLYLAFAAVVRVLRVTIVPQSEGGWYALVQVCSKNDAEVAKSRLNQMRIGKNHVVLSISGAPSPFSNPTHIDELKRRQTYSLLSNAASSNMRMDKFLELFNNKFGRGIGVNDLEQMNDIVKISEGVKGLRVSLTPAAIENGVVSAQKRLTVATDRRRSRTCFCSKPAIHNEERAVVATPKLICCVLRDQIVAILSQQPQRALTTNEICQKYAECHRTPLNPKDFGYADLKELFCDMDDLIERVENESGCLIKMRETRHFQVTLEQILYLFLFCPDKEFTLKELQSEFRSEFGFDLPMGSVKSSLSDVLEFFEVRSRIVGVRLTPLQKFALRVRRLLLNFNGDVLLTDLERSYQTQYGETIKPQVFGFPSLIGLLRAASHVLYLKGRGHSLTVCINRNFLGLLKNISNFVGESTRFSSGFEVKKTRQSSDLNFGATALQEHRVSPESWESPVDDATPVDTVFQVKESNSPFGPVSQASYDFVSPDVGQPLATSSPPPENRSIAANEPMKNNLRRDLISCFMTDGPFTNILRDAFLLTPTKASNDYWDTKWLEKNPETNNFAGSDDAFGEDIKLTSSTTSSNYSLPPLVENRPVLLLPSDFDTGTEIEHNRCTTPSYTGSTGGRRSRLAVRFANI